MTFGEGPLDGIPRWRNSRLPFELSATGSECPWPTAVVACTAMSGSGETFPADAHPLRL